jgi:MinD-like ATPase involved in chromosome partitioning or flagellar assembly
MSHTPVGLSEAITEPLACDEVELAEGLCLIPASYRLPVASVQSREITRQRLSSLLHDVQHRFDYILIDAQAGAAEMAQIAMSRKVADDVVIVTEIDRVSASALERLRAQLRDELTSDRTWIVQNKMPADAMKAPVDLMEDARSAGPIPWDADVARNYARRRLAISTQNGNDYSLAILRVLKDLGGEKIQKPFEVWVQSYTAVVRQPLAEQYADAEKEMALLRTHKSQVERRAKVSRWVGLLVALAGLIASAWVLYSAEQSRLSLEEVAPFLAVTASIAIFGLLRLFARQGAKAQQESVRVDKRLGLLDERLKRLEILRTLDPAPSFRQRRDARADGAFVPFEKHPEAAH